MSGRFGRGAGCSTQGEIRLELDLWAQQADHGGWRKEKREKRERAVNHEWTKQLVRA